MSIKMQVVKASGMNMTEVNAMDIFDFFIVINELEEKAAKQKSHG